MVMVAILYAVFSLFGDNWSLRFSGRGFGCAPFSMEEHIKIQLRRTGYEKETLDALVRCDFLLYDACGEC